jgi:hypothetical protein
MGNLQKILRYIFAVSFFLGSTLATTGCGQGHFNSPLSSLGSQSQGSTNGDMWVGVDTMGFVSGGPLNQSRIFRIDTTLNLLIISVPFPSNPLGMGASFPIQGMPGATAEIALDPQTGSWVMNLSVPLRYLVKGFEFAQPDTLPNGDALPAVPGGELPRIAGHIQNTKLNLFVYGSVKYFALFLPTPGLNPMVNLTYPIKNQAKTKILGYVSTVAQKGSFDGGVYLALILPPELARLLDNLFS